MRPISRSDIQKRNDVADILASRGDNESNRKKAIELDILEEYIKALELYKTPCNKLKFT